jgi:hypothetical protein
MWSAGRGTREGASPAQSRRPVYIVGRPRRVVFAKWAGRGVQRKIAYETEFRLLGAKDFRNTRTVMQKRPRLMNSELGTSGGP